MSEKKKLIILIVVMVALIGGSSLLYVALGDKMEMPGLVVQESSGEVVPESDHVEANSGEDVPENSDVQVNPDAEREPEVQEPAPDFTVYDSGGNAYKLSDFRGKPVVVNFWASWCGPCKSEMPDFQKVYDTYGKDIHFLMVNMTDGAQETVKSASDFIGESGYTFPVYYDTDMDAAYTYGVYSIPATYFFDEEGHGVAYGQGAMDLETILRGIEMIYPEAQ